MDTANDTSTTALQEMADLDRKRACTRCDGEQHLLAIEGGMGKYRCDTCELVVGFDLSSDAAEFLISRGLPGRYTQDRFSSVILDRERRL